MIMEFAWHALASMTLLGLSTWASNLWPGRETWWRAAVSRALWWGLPFGLIAWMDGAPVDHTMMLGCAAWLGAWTPHAETPEIAMDSDVLALDLLITLIRALVLFAFPATVFALCGASWLAMVAAAIWVLPCCVVSNRLPVLIAGMGNNREIAGVLFGISTGWWITVAILMPTPFRDLLT